MKWNKLFAKLKKPLIIAGCTLAVAFVAGFFLNCLFTYNFKFRADINLLVDGKTYLYAFLLSVIALTVVLAYYYNRPCKSKSNGFSTKFTRTCTI